ncbi:RCC1 domain-containing protein [Hyalangium versicolor]|uniref:RCC1 domain-containing protein n=1 Tax=Hyalangium versicolor TaxID=2861190 RepID=UPI001CCDAE2F|nr:MopE-related protein [Hyalangium versicolor]
MLRQLMWAVLWALCVTGCGVDGSGGESLPVETKDSRAVAAALVTSSTVTKALSAGNSHSLALRTDGSVWAWGLNSDGQLGNGTQTLANVPVRVPGLPAILAISAGRSHSLALGVDGTVWAWGQNSFGQLGDGTTTRRLSPVSVAIPGGAVAIAGGLTHSLAIAADGSVYAWGTNTYGQLGDGTTSTRLTPGRINLPVSAVAVSAGWYHSMALGANGTVWTWGRNLNGQIGNGSASSVNQLTPYSVNLVLPATAIAAGATHSLALLSNQSAVGWGQNTNGQLGNGTTATAQSTPVAVALTGAVKSIATGGNFSLAIDSTGAAWSWGQNTLGQLGDGTTTQRTSPVRVQGLGDALAVSAGLFHALALRPGCPFWAWGQNTSGQLGDGTLANQLTLTQTQLLNIYFYDLEGDGYGAELLPPEEGCQPPSVEYVENGLDCDDFDPAIHPGAAEVCDGLDNDCDGVSDEGNTSFYRDADGDGYGNPADVVQTCAQPSGYVSNSSDCNDNNSSAHPGGTEVCDGVDNNCNGSIDEGIPLNTFYRDADGDGRGNPSVSTQACLAPAGYVSNSSDCNDADATLPRSFYMDRDGDGYGDPASFGSAPFGCAPPAGYVANNSDCKDVNASVHPGAPEVCNGMDDNCNQIIDEGLSSNTYYYDGDGDGRGNPSASTQACSAPIGYVSNSSDCNDADASLPRNFSMDRDGDGYGDPASFGAPPFGCTPPAGYAANSSDCNDLNASAHPGAAEVCDGVDNNCNGSVDEGFSMNTFYRDADADGRGNPSVSTQACLAPAGYVSNSSDCNDADASLPRSFYMDRDGDGYGDPASFGANPFGCAPPAGYVANNSDCKDINASVHPGAPEVCNGMDDNCNGFVDDGIACAH